MSSLLCPHCGEPLDAWPDLGGGEHQSYVEDCAVCCRPILFHVHWSEAASEWHIEVSAEA